MGVFDQLKHCFTLQAAAPVDAAYMQNRSVVSSFKHRHTISKPTTQVGTVLSACLLTVQSESNFDFNNYNIS